MVLALSVGAATAAPRQTERSKQKLAAEQNRAEIAAKLAKLKSEVSRTEDAREDAADTLAESEEAISNANRQLHELAEEQVETNAKLARLTSEQTRLAGVVDAQKKQLATLLREQYVAGNEDRIKLLLSGDNPNRINRDLQLMAYVSQAQAKLLASLRVNLAKVESTQQKEQNAKDELDEIAQEERDQKAVLEKEKARRAALLGSLSKKLVAQRKEIGTLERDEQRMAGLVDKLSKLIKEQAEAAAAEKRRLEAVAAAKAKAKAEAAELAKARQAEKERLAREAAAKPGKPGKPVIPPTFKPDPIDADEPTVAQAEPKPDPNQAKAADIALAPAAPDGAFASLKGKLRAPVSGQVAAKFGAKRDGGPSWKGVFIKAPEGADVKAIAAGRVVFAAWMRGFGNLIIVDHGSEYLSIYGNNQSLLRRVGDAVKGGDPIAAAGNTGGGEDSGLYFELRHRGAAFNPATWVSF
ncbi:Septal ring factor EnvC, activator of murein hydrolases AmiA and AmiB [Massilia sp. CF038]|nr:Septal ring factor EnvC, activator of murein hydrolases AmiA and AmiB [Massilia sp. CF038]